MYRQLKLVVHHQSSTSHALLLRVCVFEEAIAPDRGPGRQRLRSAIFSDVWWNKTIRTPGCFTTLIVEEGLHMLTEKVWKEVLQRWGRRV